MIPAPGSWGIGEKGQAVPEEGFSTSSIVVSQAEKQAAVEVAHVPFQRLER